MAIVIAMILLILGFSGFKLFARQLPPQSMARRVNHAMSTARSFAISYNSYYEVVMDLDNRSFWIDEALDPNLPANDPENLQRRKKVTVAEPIDPRVAVEVYHNLADPSPADDMPVAGAPVTTGLTSIVFAPDGSALQYAYITFRQTADDPAVARNLHTIRVYMPTGVTDVYEHEGI